MQKQNGQSSDVTVRPVLVPYPDIKMHRYTGSYTCQANCDRRARQGMGCRSVSFTCRRFLAVLGLSRALRAKTANMRTGSMPEKLKHKAVDEHKRERGSGKGRSNGATRKDRKQHAVRVSRENPSLDESTVLDRAIEVIGDKGEAMRWLGTPVRALGYATPISLLHDLKGRKSVIATLARLEHGVM